MSPIEFSDTTPQQQLLWREIPNSICSGKCLGVGSKCVHKTAPLWTPSDLFARSGIVLGPVTGGALISDPNDIELLAWGVDER